jgi:hypothetical protein
MFFLSMYGWFRQLMSHDKNKILSETLDSLMLLEYLVSEAKKD